MFKRDRDHPGPSHYEWTVEAEQAVAGIDRAMSQRRSGEKWRRQFGIIYFLGMSLWAATLTVHGQPVLGPIAAFVFLEFALVSYRVAGIAGSEVPDATSAQRVALLLADLCERAGCPVPWLIIRDDSLRAAAVRRRWGKTALILSRPYLERVDDEALRALLAHEVIHIARGDLATARRRVWLGALGGGVALVAAVDIDAGAVHDPPIWIAAAFVGFLAATAAISTRNRPLETRADLEGATLGGSTEAMVRALRTAHALSEETRDRLYGKAPWRWILLPISWRLPSHPPMERRLERLTQAS